MHRPPAVRLVDLERRDRDRARRLREVHPELAEEAVGADGALLDRDEALEIGPRLLEQRRLRQQVAGRVAADVGRERGQVEQLLLGAEHDLDLLDRAAVADQAVLDAAADQPAAELGERPLQGRALPDVGVTMLEGDRVAAKLLEARDLERGLGSERDLGRAGEERLAGPGFRRGAGGARRACPTRPALRRSRPARRPRAGRGSGSRGRGPVRRRPSG